MIETVDYLIIGAVAGVVTFATTPVVRRVAFRLGWVYQPTERTVHTAPMPAIGGVAMFAGFLAAFAAARLLDRFDQLFAQNSEPRGIIIAAFIIVAVGLWDDVRGSPAPARVTAIVVAALVLVHFGATMYYFRIPFVDNLLPLANDWVPLITALWLLGMTQAINLIDGLDGLAAGIVAIAAFAFFLYSQQLAGDGLLVTPNFGPLIAIIGVGVCVGFLPHNFNPARIMMGDTGALLLGLMMAVATSVVGGRADPGQAGYGQTYFFLAPLMIPLLILGVPIFDMLFAIVRRASKRQSLDVADKGHLHHRLMNLGHGHRRAVLILWSWTALLSGFVLYPVLTGENPSYLPFGIAGLGIVLYTVLHPSVRQLRRQVAVSDDVDEQRPGPDDASGVGGRRDDGDDVDGSGDLVIVHE